MAVKATIIASLREQLRKTTADPERLSLLCRLCNELCAGSAEEALSEIQDAFQLAKRLNRSDEQAFLLRLRGDCQRRLERFSEACSTYRRSAELYASLQEHAEAAAVGLAHAESAIQSGAYVDGVAAYEEVFTLYKRAENHDGMLSVLKSLGDLHEQLKDHARSFDYFLRSYSIAETLEDPIRVGTSCSDLGIICVQLGRYDQAFHYYSRALDAFHEAKMPLLEVPILANLANLHVELGQLDSALDHLLKAHLIYELLGDKVGLAATLLNVGRLYERSGRPESALDQYAKALDLFDELSDNLGRGAALLGVGNVYRMIGQHQDAIWYLEHALRLAREVGDLERESQCCEFLAHSLESIGNSSSALRHLWRYTELLRSLTNSEQQKVVAEMQARFDLERAEKERKIWQLKTEQLESEMNRKTAELTKLTLQLVEKRQFIEKLTQQLETMGEESSGNVKPITEEIASQLKRSIAGADDWQIFEEQFRSVHPDLLQRLAAKWPKLTQAQLRTCALTITGLSMSQIADLLRVDIRTVETYRHRIRKTLGLDSKTHLATFLQGI